jgi:hypothetical protein
VRHANNAILRIILRTRPKEHLIRSSLSRVHFENGTMVLDIVRAPSGGQCKWLKRVNESGKRAQMEIWHDDSGLGMEVLIGSPEMKLISGEAMVVRFAVTPARP